MEHDWLIPRPIRPKVISTNQLSVMNELLVYFTSQNKTIVIDVVAFLWAAYIFKGYNELANYQLMRKVWHSQNYLPVKRQDQNIWHFK